MGDFNSTDIEFEPAPTKGKNTRGRKSIADIIESAASDRISSKKAVKQLQFGHGGPGTRVNQDMWVQRLNTFRTVTLGQSIAQPFTGDDIIRFFDVIVGKIRPGSKGKPTPSRTVVINGLPVLASYGKFTYPKKSGYELTERDSIRLQTWMDDAVKAGRLVKGTWKRRVWLNFTVVSRMGKAWLEHHHNYGTWNWDISIAKLLSIVLTASIGMRIGDVTRSRLYTAAEYMQYKHFELSTSNEMGEAKFENLRARITVELEKGAKDKTNVDTPFYVRPLDDPDQHHMCPIALILIHALRHGLVLGSTLQEVLDNAIGSANSKVVWLFPDRPILASFTSKTTREIDLEKTAGIDQALQTIKQMGVISSILFLGAAQDTAHLPEMQEGGGFATNQVRQSLGHTNSAFQRGINECYVGAPTRETYNDRAARQFESPWGSKFSSDSAFDFVKGPISNDEIREWQQLTTSLMPQIMFLIQQDAALKRTFAVNQKRGNKEVLAQRPASEVNKITTNASTSSSSIKEKYNGSARTAESWTGFDLNDIDPRLLDQTTLENIEIDAVDFEELENKVLFTRASQVDEDSQEADDIAMTQALFEGFDATCNKSQATSAYDFIARYSKINVVGKAMFARAWVHYLNGIAFDDSIGKHSVSGNSRDPPTPMVYHCKKTIGCPFTNIRSDMVMNHEIHCSADYIATTRRKDDTSEECFVCTWTGCDKKFPTKENLVGHIQRLHEFEAKACPNGCEPEKIYMTEPTYKVHMQNFHSGRWPAQCLFPDCKDVTAFKTEPLYATHLIQDHGLNTRADRAPHLPPNPERMYRVWEPTGCPLEGCTNKTKFKAKYDLKNHIVDKHAYEKDAANDLVGCGNVMKPGSQLTDKEKKRARGERMGNDAENEAEEETSIEPETSHMKKKKKKRKK